MIEMKVRIGWFLFCPIMIFEGKMLARRMGYNKYLYIAAHKIFKVMKIVLYCIGFNRIRTKVFLKITGTKTIYLEDDVYEDLDIYPGS